MNVIVLAAGSGKRLGGELPKQYLLLNVKPVLYYSLKVFEKSPLVESISVVISQEAQYLYDEFLSYYGAEFSKLTSPFFGGKERCDSVFNAMSEIAKKMIPNDQGGDTGVQREIMTKLVRLKVNPLQIGRLDLH